MAAGYALWAAIDGNRILNFALSIRLCFNKFPEWGGGHLMDKASETWISIKEVESATSIGSGLSTSRVGWDTGQRHGSLDPNPF